MGRGFESLRAHNVARCLRSRQSSRYTTSAHRRRRFACASHLDRPAKQFIAYASVLRGVGLIYTQHLLRRCRRVVRTPSLASQVPPHDIWWVWRSWLARQIVALEAVGSSPTIHPLKNPRKLSGLRGFLLAQTFSPGPDHPQTLEIYHFNI